MRKPTMPSLLAYCDPPSAAYEELVKSTWGMQANVCHCTKQFADLSGSSLQVYTVQLKKQAHHCPQGWLYNVRDGAQIRDESFGSDETSYSLAMHVESQVGEADTIFHRLGHFQDV